MKRFAIIALTFVLTAGLMTACRRNDNSETILPTDTLGSTGSTAETMPGSGIITMPEATNGSTGTAGSTDGINGHVDGNNGSDVGIGGMGGQ